jgi:hypothetical protein
LVTVIVTTSLFEEINVITYIALYRFTSSIGFVSKHVNGPIQKLSPLWIKVNSFVLVLKVQRFVFQLGFFVCPLVILDAFSPNFSKRQKSELPIFMLLLLLAKGQK